MAIESPLFQSAMELLGHSLSHFNGMKELDRKLVILHLANAVELILKDLILDAGVSIYKNPKETISIQGCIAELEKNDISVPYLNKIELLIDERNALQHRFGSPNELTAIFYMTIAQEFFKEVLKKHYSQDYKEIIPQFTEEKDLVAYSLREPANDQELERLLETAQIHPLAALLAAWTYFEKTMDRFFEDVGLSLMRGRPRAMNLTEGRFEKFGIALPDELEKKFNRMRSIRNLAVHGRQEPHREQVREFIETIGLIEKHFDALDKEKIKQKARKEREAQQAERKEYLKRNRPEGMNVREQMAFFRKDDKH